MNRLLRLLAAASVCGGLLVALAACAGLEASGQSGPPIPAPAYAVGDRWVYEARDGFRAPVVWQETREVVAIDASGIAVRITQKGPSVDNVRTETWAAPEVVRVGAAFDEE